MRWERISMDIEPKEAVEWLGMAAASGGMWAWVKNLGSRVRKVEKRIENEHGEPLIMTLAAHDIICPRNTGVLMAEMQHVTAAVKGLSEIVEKQNAKLAEVAEVVAILDDRAKRRRGGDNE